MSDEKHNLQRQADRAKPNHKRSLINYLLILFAAAVVLLLFAYLMQQRSTSEQTLNGIQQSISAMQSAQEVYEENGTLKEEINALGDQIAQMEDQIRLMQDKLDRQDKENQSMQTQITDLQKSNQAMDWFWQIDEAYVRGRYNVCRELIEKMTAEGLQDYLPLESSTNTDRFSPAHRLEEIQEKLGD